MKPTLCLLIQQIKLKDNSALKNLISIFSSQLTSYSKKLNGDDTYQDLLIFLFTLIQKLNPEKFQSWDEKALTAYISRSLRNEYIRLSRRRSSLIKHELPLDMDFAKLLVTYDKNHILINELLTNLKPKEEIIVRLIYFYGFSVQEISYFMHVSRQAINQIKIRALKKLKSSLSKKDAALFCDYPCNISNKNTL